MNPVSQVLQNHRSIRHFKDTPVSNDILMDIIHSAHRAPTSSNLHDVTAITITNKETKAKIAKLAGAQSWIEKCPVFIVLVMDYNKTRIGVEEAGGTSIMEETLEAVIAGALDSGIALANMMATAQAHGLGIVPIGGIRNNMPKMAKILNLPQGTAPLVGMCLGHIEADASIKPRMNIESFLHSETYNNNAIKQGIETYNADIKQHWADIGRADGKTWSENLIINQEKFAKRHMKDDLEKLGFFKNGVK